MLHSLKQTDVLSCALCTRRVYYYTPFILVKFPFSTGVPVFNTLLQGEALNLSTKCGLTPRTSLCCTVLIQRVMTAREHHNIIRSMLKNKQKLK